jgi:hypothetical protein
LAPVGTADKRESRLAKIAAPATPVVAIAAAESVAEAGDLAGM